MKDLIHKASSKKKKKKRPTPNKNSKALEEMRHQLYSKTWSNKEHDTWAVISLKTSAILFIPKGSALLAAKYNYHKKVKL